MSKQQYRLGIDAGGTFTDFILADHQGNVQLFAEVVDGGMNRRLV